MSVIDTQLREATLCGVGLALMISPLALQVVEISVPALRAGGAGSEIIVYLTAVVVRPVLSVLGASFAVTGAIKLRGRHLSQRISFLIPALAATIVVLSFGRPALSSLASMDSSGVTQAGVATAIVGGMVVPLVLAALREDSLVVITAATLLLGGSVTSPSTSISLTGGLVCGLASVGGLWYLDEEAWRPSATLG